MIETLLLLFVLAGLLYNYLMRVKNFPPGPIGVPYVGIYPFVDHSKPTDTFDILRQKYGDVIGVVILNFRVVIVNGWVAIKEAMLNDDFAGRPDVCLIRDRFEGEILGVVFKEGDPWRVHRRFLLHHFRNLGFGRSSHENVVLEECQELVDIISEKKGKPFFLEDELSVSAINVTWAILGGKRCTHKDATLLHLTKKIREAMHGVQIIGSPAVVFPFVRYMFPKLTGYQMVKDGSREVNKFTQRIIEEHKKTRDPNNARDFIDIFLEEMGKNSTIPEQTKKENLFTEKHLRALLLDIMSGSADTTSGTMMFSMLLMVMYPEVQRRCQEELDSVLGCDDWPTMQDKPRLVYTEAALSETMRYRYVAPTVVPHKALRNTTLQGYSVPKDTIVFLNFRSVFMDKEYWTDPDVFRPERFISDDGTYKKIERFVPFGKGKRNCLGESLARMLTFLSFASLLHRFTFQLPPGETLKDTDGTHGFTLAPPTFNLVAIPRHPKSMTCV